MIKIRRINGPGTEHAALPNRTDVIGKHVDADIQNHALAGCRCLVEGYPGLPGAFPNSLLTSGAP